MALTSEQWKEVSDAIERLRALGCAVCIFTPDDVESAANEDDTPDEDGDQVDEVTAEQAADWLLENRKYLEDTMSTAGNLFIGDNVTEIRNGG